MALRKLTRKVTRSRARAAPSLSASAPQRALIRTEAVLQCTRVMLRACSETELVHDVCAALVQCGLYADASIELETLASRPPKAARARRADRLEIPLTVEGQPIAVLMLRTHGRRLPDTGEFDQLQSLTLDAARAIARIRSSERSSVMGAREKSLQETIAHAGVGITHVDQNGYFVEVNQKFCEMLGYSRAELIGRAARDLTVAEDLGRGAAFRAAALSGAATIYSGEKRYIHKDGTHVWVRRTMSPAYDACGAVRGAISVIEHIDERKRAQDAVIAERTLLRTIIDAVPHYIYVKDRHGRFTLVNKAWLEWRGACAEEIKGKTATDMFPAAIAEEMEAQDQPVLSRGEALLDVEQHLVLAAPDNQTVERWSSTTKVPLRNAGGEIIGLVGISRDITDSKRAEKELREHVERFEIAARATSDVIWDWDIVRDTLWWGEGVEKLFQYRRDEIEPTIESWTSRIHPMDRAEVTRGIHAAIEERATFWSADYRFCRRDGTYADVYDRAFIIRDDRGRAVRMLGAMMDMSERKRADEAIRRERALLRTIIDALPDYVYVKDIECRYQLANKAWLQARHMTSEELGGKTSYDVFPASVAERLHQQDRTVIEHGMPVMDNVQPIYTGNEHGQEVQAWCSATKVPMRDEGGRIIGVVGISRDITARRRMERERTMEHVVARVLAESRSVEETMPKLIRTICEAMGWAYGARWVCDHAEDNLRRAEWWCDTEPDFDAQDRDAWLELGPPQAGGLVRRVWLDQRPTWFNDITQVHTFRRKVSCIKLGFRSAYAFPILAHDERVGVMEFFGREAREPDDALLQVTTAIANQIGQFVRRKQAEESLQESEQQLRAMFDNADVGIAMTGLDMRYLRVNDKFCDIVGYERSELLNMLTSDVNLDQNVHEMLQARRQMASAEVVTRRVEKQLVRKDETLVWVSTAVTPVRGPDGKPRYFIAVVHDISESKRAAAALKQSEEQFRLLAHYDSLTGLPNRALFYDRLSHSLAQARRNRWVLAVMFIDVDRFKHVNDTFGHAAGDQLLKQVSRRLSECMRSDDTVGRLSGDEFAIVLTQLSAAEDAAGVAKKIVNVLNTPFQLEGAELFVTASIGITVYPSDSTEQDTLIRNADVAMYRAKELGRNNYQFYTPEMNRRTREMLSMEGELKRALERDEFVLHYQPKVSLSSGRITGVEALLRWRHPERGLVPPAAFIPLLEETGLIVQAGDWVLRAVCRQIDTWRSAGVPLVPIAVNLSARQFLAPDLGQNMKQILETHAVAAELVEVEITESSVMTNAEDAIRTLEYLQALGIQTAIDDFGTGYSSLSYLKRFPLKALKVDRSFVRDITTDPDDATITQAVISMAHSLGLKVVAEGVETEAQLAFLMRCGCDEVQGFLFSRPIPGDECAALVADHSRIASIIETVNEVARNGRD